jgi:hypothetical protein
MANTVKFYSGTKQAFDSLLNNDPSGLYFVDGLLYRGSELYTKIYRQVTEYPIYGEENITYINTSDGSVKYWEDNKYHNLCNPIITKLDNYSTNAELASAKAIYNAIIENKCTIDRNTIDTMITDRLGYMGGASVTDYIKVCLDNLIDGAPETLDTFKELAAALSDDDSLIASLTTLINSKADTSSVRLASAPIAEADLDYDLAQKINTASDFTLLGPQIDDSNASYTKAYSSQKVENEINSAICDLNSSLMEEVDNFYSLIDANKVSKSSIVNNLTSTVEGSVLDSRQGKVLSESITAIYNNLKDMWKNIYPVGSIYLSVSSTNPTTLFGGTWVALQDRFLVGAGNTYSNGITGGEATHTLTTSEMPSHAHTRALYANVDTNFTNFTQELWPYGGKSVATAYGSSQLSDYTGGGGAHNNLPPYLSVYMWKRTA